MMETSANDIELVVLKNGSREPKVGVLAASVSISSLFERDPLTAYDLVMVCRDQNYKPFGVNGKRLQDLALLQSNGKPHDTIRNTVLSGAVGDGLNMRWQNPIR